MRTCLLLILAIASAVTVSAQKDSLVLNNGDVIIGELKSLQNAVLKIETDYSKDDFTIKWKEVRMIHTHSHFLITLENGDRINGSVASVDSAKLAVTDLEGNVTLVDKTALVYLNALKSDFWSRFKASVDLGVSLTKANNLQQFSVRSNFGYLADRWQLDGYFNSLHSRQDSVDATKRYEGGIKYRYFLENDWFLAASVELLSNTEQALRLRTTGKAGGGKMIVHTNRSIWGAGVGLSYNNESFTNETPGRRSLEGYIGSELNLFDIGDLSLSSNLYVYPSFTESGRWRSDFQFDAKYDLPLNFYVKGGVTMNYDNRPAVQGNELDYVMQFTFGWEL
ncbi:DUF481 domain-containing protein [Chitinophaga lutea]